MFLFVPNTNAFSYDSYIADSQCRIRLKASDTSDLIKENGNTLYVYPNQQLEYIKTELGPLYGEKNKVWYAVKFDNAGKTYTGYIASICFYDVKTYKYDDESDFENKISGFPESYKVYLRKLHTVHPNWNFEADNNNLDWNESLNVESVKGTSAVSSSYPSLIYKDSANPNGIVVDGTSWYAPTRDAVAYYLDPRNFLNENRIFMFEKLGYSESSNASVQKLLNGTFMEGTYFEDGVNKSYANTFIEAAKEANVSPVHLVSRAIQEVGTNGSSAVSGTVAGYEGYYNFYNIGAYSGELNYINGLIRAKEEGWNSITKAIKGGAKFIASSYVSRGQDTIYFQKFNVASYRKKATYAYQYQTNIMAPYQESSKIYNSYKNSNKLDDSYTFTIPVYSNMPNEAFKVGVNDYLGLLNNNTSTTTTAKKETTTTVKKEETTPVNNISTDQKISNSGYNIKLTYLTKLKYMDDVSNVKNNLVSKGANVSIMSSSWVSKVTGSIATGDILSIDNKVYEACIYGDPSGDGVISIKDLLIIQKYLLGSRRLEGVYNNSADVSKDGVVSIKDLLIIQKYLLGVKDISQ